MIKAVIDTNVLVVAPLPSDTPPGKILDAWEFSQFELLVSEHILFELENTLQKPYFRARLTGKVIQRFQKLLRRRATLITINVQVQGVATHLEDDLILATAVSGKADYLVTGDKPLRKAVPKYRRVKLVTPVEFLKVLEKVRKI